MTHGICKLISLKLKMSIFPTPHPPGIIYVIVGWGKKKTALTAVICLAKNKLPEQRLVNSGVRAFLAEV